MAAMVGAFTNIIESQGFRNFVVEADMALSGDYVTGGVDVFTGVQGLMVPTTKPFQHVNVKGKAGYIYEYDYPNKKLLIRQEGAAGAPSVELSAAVLPGGVTGDSIRVRLESPKFG